MSRILVRLPNWVGDTVLATPALKFLRKHFDGEILLAGRKPAVELLNPNPFEASVVEFNGRGFKEALRIRNFAPDIAITMPSSFSSALFIFITGAKTRVGFKGDMRDFLLTNKVVLPSAHRADAYIKLIELALGTENREELKTGLLLTDSEFERASELIEGLRRPIVVLNPNSRAESRRWPIEHWQGLIRLLNGEKIIPVVVGGREDRGRAQLLRQDSRLEFLDLTGKTTLRELAALLKLANIFISNDSGPAHIGYTVGTRTIVLFGAGNERRTGPYKTLKAKVIRADNIPCAPCEKNVCPLSHLKCMWEINPKEVYKKAMEFLEAP